MASTALILEVSRETGDPDPLVEASEMNELAYKLWQRGCAAQAVEQEWLTPEECILIPH